MRFIGVCVASLALTLALPTPQTGKLVPREGDLEAAIYDETIAGIAGDPYIANALEDSDDTGNAGIAADEDPTIPEILNDIPVDPVAELPLDGTDDPAYQQDPLAPYADDLLPLDIPTYDDQAIPDALAPEPDAAPLDSSEYLAALPKVDVPEVPPISQPIPAPAKFYNDLPPALPVPPTAAEYLAEQPIQQAVPAPNPPSLLSSVPANMPPAPQAPAAPASDNGYASNAYTLAPIPPAYKPVDLPAEPLDAQVDPLPPAAVPAQAADVQPQTGTEKDAVAEDSAPFNPLGDLFQGLYDGLDGLLSGLNGISGPSEGSPADDPYPVAQPAFAV